MATVQVVLGLGFGDEGKGRTVSYLCSKAPESLVVRFSGGQQAGHNVMLSEDKFRQHVFSNFGSGTMQGCDTYWSEFCTFDPLGVVNEAKALRDKGYSTPSLIVNQEAPVTTPYDKHQNLVWEGVVSHGTCGVGVGETWRREAHFHSIKVKDLFFPEVLKIKLEILRERYYANSTMDDTQIKIGNWFDICERATRLIHAVDRIPDTYGNYIFEGSQGLMLDQHVGFFPYVTRSNTGLENVYKIFLKIPRALRPPEIYLVTRAYQTRHGAGPITYSLWQDHNIRINPYEINKDTGHQGKFRRTLLDLDLLRYAIKSHQIDTSNATLVITCLDLMERYSIGLGGKVFGCEDNEDKFINSVNTAVKAKHVWRSASPYTEQIETH